LVEEPLPVPVQEEELAMPAAVEPVPYVEEETVMPAFSLDSPLPASALDGYVLDEDEVFNALTQFDTNSVEAESDILEAVAVTEEPTAPIYHEPLVVSVPDVQAHIPAPPPPIPQSPPPPAPTPVQSAPIPAPIAPEAPLAAAPAKPKNSVKHGFDF
jgi:hypothetical protein